MRDASISIALSVAIAASCTSDAPPAQRRIEAPGAGIELPHLDGWYADQTVPALDPVKGGTALRLTRSGGVPGSPRIEVEVAPAAERPTRLGPYLSQNLSQMATMASEGGINITQEEKREIRIGPRRGYRVIHSYTVGSGGSQVAITQVSTILVLDGRGITVSAVGRTELFHPLGAEINRILDGVNTPIEKAVGQPIKLTPQPVDDAAPQRIVPLKPVDLNQADDG